MNEVFLPLSQIIELAKKRKIYLGRGTPQNRIAYFVKLGLIPHAIRRTNPITGKIEAHFPISIIESINEINGLKRKKYASSINFSRNSYRFVAAGLNIFFIALIYSNILLNFSSNYNREPGNEDNKVLGVETYVISILESPIARFFNNLTSALRTSVGVFIVTLLPEDLVNGDKRIEKPTSITYNLPSNLTLSNFSVLESVSIDGSITKVTNITATGDIKGNNLTVSGTINGNTFTDKKLVFLGESPSIYPITTNTGISINGNGTGAINIGNSGTGDVYIAGGSGDGGCTITNSTGTLNCSSNITSAGDLIANGGDILTDKTTLNLGSSSVTINISGNTTLEGTLSVTGASTFTGNLTVNGRPTFTKVPTSAHTGTFTIDSSTWNVSDASIYVNPSTATADSNLLGVAVNGNVKFDVDAEGDVFARNLVLTGNTTTGTTTVSGDLSVEGNTTLGDATTDTFTVNTATLTWAGGNKTLDITGAATRTLTLLNSTAGQVADIDISDGSLKVNGTSVITNARAGSFTDVAGTITTASQTNITSVGTLGSLAVTGNINSSTGSLQTNGVTRVDNSGNLTAGTGSFSGTVTIGSGTGKITVGTIDPPYTIGGEKYATYLSSMTGVNEETAGTVKLDKNGKFEIDFTKAQKGSNLWLFYQVTDFGKNWENLTAVLTPNFKGSVWYVKDPERRKLTIYSNTSGEVSYHFISPRFDYINWTNTRTDEAEGFVLSEKK